MVRRRFQLIALSVALTLALLVAPQAAGAAEVENGSFETGDFSGWTTDQPDPGGGQWTIYTDTEPPFDEEQFDFVPAPPCETHASFLTQFDPSSDILYQDIALEADASHELSFSHWYLNDFIEDGPRLTSSAGPDSPAGGLPPNFITPDTLSIVDVENQQYRIDIMDPAADPFSVEPGDIHEMVFRTEAGDPDQLGPVEVTVDLSAYAGQTVRLRYAVAVTENPLSIMVDCVQVTSTPLATTTSTTVTPTTAPAARPAQVVAARPAFTG